MDSISPFWAAIGGGAITGSVTVLSLLISRYFDERRERRELIVRIATENYGRYADAAKRLGGNLEPIESFIIHATEIMKIVDDGVSSESEIRDRLRKAYGIQRAVSEEIDKAQSAATTNDAQCDLGSERK